MWGLVLVEPESGARDLWTSRGSLVWACPRRSGVGRLRRLHDPEKVLGAAQGMSAGNAGQHRGRHSCDASFAWRQPRAGVAELPAARVQPVWQRIVTTQVAEGWRLGGPS
jgi:hypothetical protein